MFAESSKRRRNELKSLKLLALSLTIAALLFVTPVLAVKPAGNLASAEKIDWNLSGAVMPSPPWGLHDITGSDTSSKLIVNQPMGNTIVTLTGAMNGLDPNTVYTVYVSNGWTTTQVWSVTGTWVIAVNNGAYPHDYTFTMTSLLDGTFTGVGGYPASGPPYTYDEIVINGHITGNTITFTAVYYNPITHLPTGYSWTGTGTIDNNGYLVLGTGTSGVYEWHSTSGQATHEIIGAGHPGLFGNLQTFTFTTDAYGAGSWHINLVDSNFPDTGTYSLSVWINNDSIPATVLISDNFSVTLS